MLAKADNACQPNKRLNEFTQGDVLLLQSALRSIAELYAGDIVRWGVAEEGRRRSGG